VRWVKLHTTLHRNVAFRRLSPAGKLTFYVALEIAADVEQGGALSIRSIGPMTVREIADEVGLDAKRTNEALNELIGIGFVLKREDGAYVIDRWAEKTGNPDDPTNSDRQRRHRAKRNGKVTRDTVTAKALPEEEVEEEGEVDLPRGKPEDAPSGCDCSAVRSPCPPTSKPTSSPFSARSRTAEATRR